MHEPRDPYERPGGGDGAELAGALAACQRRVDAAAAAAVDDVGDGDDGVGDGECDGDADDGRERRKRKKAVAAARAAAAEREASLARRALGEPLTCFRCLTR